MAEWMNYDKWKAGVLECMGNICEQADLPTGDWPHIPDIRGRGFDPMGAAFYLLDNAGRLDLAKQWWLIIYVYTDDRSFVKGMASQGASARTALEKAKVLMNPVDLRWLNADFMRVETVFGPFDKEPEQHDLEED